MCDCWGWPWLPGWSSARFLCRKVILFSISVLSSLEGSHEAQPTQKAWRIMCPFCYGGAAHVSYLEFFYRGDLFVLHLSMCSVLYSCQDGRMHVYFVRWVIIQSVPALATGGAFSWLWCLVDLTPSGRYLFIFEHLFTFWHYRMLQGHLVYFLLQT